MYTNHHIGFLGLGVMGSAIARGMLNKHPELNLFAYDPASLHLPQEKWNERIRIMADAASLEKECDILILCVKPQNMAGALEAFKGNKRYISIAAGLSLDTIRAYTGCPEIEHYARVMPNIAALIGQSVTGLFCPDRELASLSRAIFSDVGFVAEVQKEDQLHAVTALAGSGPAFVFEFLHALAEGGVLEGLPYETSLELAVHTLEGAAALVRNLKEHPGTLRNRVTSAGGTTIAGLHSLAVDAFHGSVMNAVQEASRRSRELGA